MLFLPPKLPRPPFAYLLPLLLAVSQAAEPGNTSVQDVPTRASVARATSQPTCESRTVNYITHTLPQQCLTSPPTTPSPSPEPTSTNATPSAGGSSSSSTAAGGPASAVETEEQELDSDGNDLSTGAFMSFEEWKAMMLQKAGQEALEAPPKRKHDGRGDGSYSAADLDALGDDGEIAIDFDVYSDKISEIASSARPASQHAHDQKSGGEESQQQAEEKLSFDEGLGHVYRSKDAGKTGKERFSYSSFDAGATVLKTSRGAKHASAILVENKDSYMLLECAAQSKFFIVELSDDILVDTVVLANFEFFSSMIRQFRVSVSDRYPVKLEKWKNLGTYEARNSRDIQAFLIENPQIWARYLRIELLTHYGNEYYCPVSLLRVHGTRMLDSWKEADPSDPGIDSDDEVVAVVPEQTEEALQVVEEEVPFEEPVQEEKPVIVAEQSPFVAYWDQSYFEYSFADYASCEISAPVEPAPGPTETAAPEGAAVTTSTLPARTAEQSTTILMSSSSVLAQDKPSASQNATASSPTSASSMETAAPSFVAGNATELVANQTASTASQSGSSTGGSGSSSSPSVKSSATNNTPANPPPGSQQKTGASTSLRPPSSRSPVPKATSGTQTTSRNKTATSTTAASASPTVQDSFFKALTKRLQVLESNTTLSLQYIESQSKFLQEALSRLEKRQVAKVDQFLSTLNATVLSELRDVRTQYDQIWQSTIIALETQREQSEREIVALSTRLGVLADEVVFQKRMAIVQSLLLLGCLVLVIFSRGGLAATGVEMYYPSQLLGGGHSRAASPLFPSTPKRMAKLRPQNGLDDDSEERSSTEIKRRSRLLESDAAVEHHTPAMSASAEILQGSDRATLPQEADQYTQTNIRQPKTATWPSSLSAGEVGPQNIPTPGGAVLGYGSDAAQVQSIDYFSTIQNSGDSGRDLGFEPMGSSYSESLARRANRQLTPSSEADGMDYSPSIARPSLSHSSSSRKPLPALPEDPD